MRQLRALRLEVADEAHDFVGIRRIPVAILAVAEPQDESLELGPRRASETLERLAPEAARVHLEHTRSREHEPADLSDVALQPHLLEVRTLPGDGADDRFFVRQTVIRDVDS